MYILQAMPLLAHFNTSIAIQVTNTTDALCDMPSLVCCPSLKLAELDHHPHLVVPHMLNP